MLLYPYLKNGIFILIGGFMKQIHFISESYRQIAKELIKGGYDLHTHTEPSAFHRALDDFDLVREAGEAGMAGVLIKAHYGCTAARAALVNLHSNSAAKAFGSLALNQPVGGLNPYAVENSLKMGAVIIWMPTRDSENCLKFGDMPGDFFQRPGISIFNENRELKKEIFEIFDIIKKYGACLATGHLDTKEAYLLCKTGRKHGVNMILTHPEWNRTKSSGAIQKELADTGVLIEKNWLNIAEGSVSAEEMASNIRNSGVNHVYLSTDRGQAGFEHPVEGMLCFIETLLAQGFSENEIKTMLCTVPGFIVSRNTTG